MSELLDKVTYIAKIATDILFIKNPINTSMGAFFGIVLNGLLGLFDPFLKTINFIAISSLNLFHEMAIGIFLFNIKPFLNRNKINPEVENAINFIDEQMKAGRINKTEAQLRYRALISKMVENVQFDVSTSSKVQALVSSVVGKSSKS